MEELLRVFGRFLPLVKEMADSELTDEEFEAKRAELRAAIQEAEGEYEKAVKELADLKAADPISRTRDDDELAADLGRVGTGQ